MKVICFLMLMLLTGCSSWHCVTYSVDYLRLYPNATLEERIFMVEHGIVPMPMIHKKCKFFSEGEIIQFPEIEPSAVVKIIGIN